MSRIIEINIENTIPDIDSVLKQQGVGEDYEITEVITSVFSDALELYKKTVCFQGIYDAVSFDEFKNIYEGEGLNDAETPVADIYPKADRLSLFAITLGEAVSQKISVLMQNGDYALSVMLDAAASQGAERAADQLERHYKSEVLKNESSLKVLRYSPGYCGWHVSGQKKLFTQLQPEEIGITLNERCLMEPLKSISGVLIAAEKENHYFDMTYACCESCDSYNCRDRLAGIDGA